MESFKQWLFSEGRGIDFDYTGKQLSPEQKNWLDIVFRGERDHMKHILLGMGYRDEYFIEEIISDVYLDAAQDLIRGVKLGDVRTWIHNKIKFAISRKSANVSALKRGGDGGYGVDTPRERFKRVPIDDFGSSDNTLEIEKMELIQRIKKFIERWPESRNKQIIQMYYIQELSLPEVAQRLNMSESATKSALFRARESLMQNEELRRYWELMNKISPN